MSHSRLPAGGAGHGCGPGMECLWVGAMGQNQKQAGATFCRTGGGEGGEAEMTGESHSGFGFIELLG